MATQLLINIRTSEGIIATPNPEPGKELNDMTANDSLNFIKVTTSDCVLPNESLGQSKMSKISHSMQPKRGIYLLKSGASRTAHRALRPTMLFGQVPAACSGRSKSSG